MKKLKKGFSLIELFIVLSIILLLSVSAFSLSVLVYNKMKVKSETDNYTSIRSFMDEMASKGTGFFNSDFVIQSGIVSPDRIKVLNGEKIMVDAWGNQMFSLYEDGVWHIQYQDLTPKNCISLVQSTESKGLIVNGILVDRGDVSAATSACNSGDSSGEYIDFSSTLNSEGNSLPDS